MRWRVLPLVLALRRRPRDGGSGARADGDEGRQGRLEKAGILARAGEEGLGVDHKLTTGTRDGA